MDRRQLMVGLADNDSQASLLLGLGGSILFIVCLLVSARLWSRMRPTINLHADDWTVFAATLLIIINALIVTVACSYGFGRRAKYVPLASRISAMRLLFITQIIWYWNIALAKLSVALLLMRLKPTRSWRIFLFVVMGILVLTAMVQTFFQFLQCRPFRIYWDPSAFRTGATCVPQRAITANIIAGSSVHVLVDLIFSFVPITFIRKLHRPRGERIFLGVLMGLGLFASSFAILRTVGLQAYYKERDIFRATVMPTIWATLELEVALIAATMPTLKSFMQKSLVAIGRYFYDQESETQIRGKMVDLGLLEKCNNEFASRPGTRTERKPSKPDVMIRQPRNKCGDTIGDHTVVNDIGLKTVASNS